VKSIGTRQIANRRLGWAVLAMAAFAVLAGKLFYVQIMKHDHYYRQAQKIQARRWPIEAPRGNIYDQNGNPLALNLKLYSVAADPELVESAEAVAADLTPLLRTPRNTLTKKLTADGQRRYVRLQDSVDQPIADSIRELHCPGIIVNTQWRRAYPHGTLAAPLLGFTGKERSGLGGIEQALNDRLAGSDGEMLAAVDGRLPRSRSQIPGRTIVSKRMVPGSSVVLTIDLDIQAIAEEELAKAVEQANAASGTALVMDPQNGEVLALASQPSFDPNEFWRYPERNWVCPAVVSPYEPGSTFKVITAVAALEEGVMSHGETYHCTGSRSVGQRTVSCVLHGGRRDHGVVNLDDMITKSCNTGIATVAIRLGAGRINKWLKRFGFGEQTGIELSGESRGLLPSGDDWPQIRVANVGFGQGIAVTPLQLLSAYCAIANGGWLVRPRVVKAVTDAGGKIEALQTPKPERILSTATSERLKEMMTKVVTEGTGAGAQIHGRTVAGKTGTAQKPTPEKGFRSGLYVGSFAGFAPVSDPQLAVLVVIDEPQNGHYGGVVAAPAFRAICERALTYLRVPPDGLSPGIDAPLSLALAAEKD